jgi:hypothetical protein
MSIADRTWLMWGLVAFGCFLVVIWPKWNCPHNGDEFGYYENLALTLREGRWVSSQWLEPLNCPLVFGGLSIYTLTESFYLATLGLTFVLALANYLLLDRLLMRQFVGAPIRTAMVWLISISPLLLNKTIEYTGFVFNITAILAALLAWQRSRLWMFYSMVFIGFLSRQSTLLLLAIPVIDAVRERKAKLGHVGGVIITSLLAVGVLRIMPKTLAWEIATTKMSTQVSLASVVPSALGGLISVVSLWALWHFFANRCTAARLSENLRTPLLPAFFSVVLVFLGYFQLFFIDIGTPALQPIAGFFPYLMVPLLWLVDRKALPALPAWGFVGSYCLIVAVRGKWWDQYLVDPLLILVAFTTASGTVVQPGRQWIGRSMLASAFVLFSLYAVVLKRGRENIQARVVRFEHELRNGTREIPFLHGSSFGFKGWKLFPAVRPDPNGKLIDFLHFVPVTNMPVAPLGCNDPRAIGDSYRSEFPTGERWNLPTGYKGRPLPLSDAEWREFIMLSTPGV